jgi:hypothetical protein
MELICALFKVVYGASNGTSRRHIWRYGGEPGNGKCQLSRHHLDTQLSTNLQFLQKG